MDLRMKFFSMRPESTTYSLIGPQMGVALHFFSTRNCDRGGESLALMAERFTFSDHCPSWIRSRLMMLTVYLSFFLCLLRFSNSAYVGDACTASGNNPGICRLVDQCQSVLDELRAGKMPESICGYEGFLPIVCCPSIAPTTSTARPTQSQNLVGDGRGEIARAKCAEYARHVYALVYPPITVGELVPVNISQCAIKSQKLIVGGVRAEPKEFPHMAAVGYDMGSDGIGWYCGGSLISADYVLTAAHCTFSREWGSAIRVRVGDLNLVRQDDRAEPQERNIIGRIRHPDYEAPLQYNDIALLKLDSKVTFSAWVRPACIHTSPDTGTSSAIATGWGRVDWFDDDGSNDLLKVTLRLVDQQTCNHSWTSGTFDSRLQNGIVGDSMICAGEFGRDTCQGDSGGPLVVYSTTQKCMYDLVGVTSFGRLCGSANPGVYTRVYNYIGWIEKTVWPQG